MRGRSVISAAAGSNFVGAPAEPAMQATPENLQAMAGMLEQTLNPELRARKAAEEFLGQHAGAQGYGLVLLQLLTMEGVPAHVRQAGAVASSATKGSAP